MSLIFKTTFPISVPDREEHGQDVYTAECKHVRWPSLNKKSSKSPVRSANTQSDSICPVRSRRLLWTYLHKNIVCVMHS